MKPELTKLAAIAAAIRTPLALAGLITVVLYAIYRQVLSLPVFENIGANLNLSPAPEHHLTNSSGWLSLLLSWVSSATS